MEKLNLRITTKSNVFIGGSPATFEIGGIDMYTITDYKGNPYIPASTFKGKLRTIIHDMIQEGDPECNQIKEAYLAYLKQIFEKSSPEKIKKVDDTRYKHLLEIREKRFQEASAEYLFGIDGFNRTPKLMFSDFIIEPHAYADPFSIDSKNSIKDEGDGKITSNPRIYQTIRPGISFHGEILFYQMEQLQIPLDIIQEVVKRAVLRFNDDIYRIGNSGSRGYGKIEIEVLKECEAHV